VDLIDCINDNFFVDTGDQPYQLFCDQPTNENFFMIVECDTRADMSNPPPLIGDMTGHLIEYNCEKEVWIDLGPFNALPGPTGPTGPPGKFDNI
jgi:hypothetical protein